MHAHKVQSVSTQQVPRRRSRIQCPYPLLEDSYLVHARHYSPFDLEIEVTPMDEDHACLCLF
jgi:hypothetical protein